MRKFGPFADLARKLPATLPLSLLAALVVALAPAAQPTHAGTEPNPHPNIVFVLTDDQSLESVAKMPFVSQYAGWHHFLEAFIGDPMCCPSRATILTGQYAHHTEIENNGDRNQFDDSSTIATWLDAAGYRTGLIGKYHLGGRFGTPPNYIPPGWDEWAAFRDEASYYNYTLNENGNPVFYGSAPEDYSTDVLGAKAVDFINRADGTTPFFLYLATRSPHDSFQAAPRYEGRFKDEPIPHTPNYNEPDVSDKPSWWQGLTPRDPTNADNARRKQYASLLAVDDWVKAIFDALTAKGLVDNTVVVFMTDNGVTFAEHRWRGKGCAYEECIRTPLLVAYPAGTPRAIQQLVSNVDIAPTFAELGGAIPTSPVDGHSLVPFLTESTKPPDWKNEVLLRFKHDSSQDTPPSFWGLRTRRYKYIETVDSGEFELYDLVTDPYELQNVADNPAYADTRQRLAQRLAELRAPLPDTPTITLVEALQPASDPGRFDLHLDGSVIETSAGNGDSVSMQVFPGKHAMFETAAAGTSLSSYTTSIACTVNSVPGPVANGTTHLELTFNFLDQIVCKFTNLRKARITLTKSLLPSSDPGHFELKLGNTVVKASAGDGGSGQIQVASGTYKVSEVASSGTTLSDYASSIACTRNGAPGPRGSGTSLMVTTATGDVLACTLTNRRTGRITLTKSLVPSSDPGRFDLKVGPTVVRAGAGDGDSGSTQVAPGTYSISEASTPGSPTNYGTSISCTLNGGPGPTASGTSKLQVTVAAYDELACTLTNRRKAQVTLAKSLVPSSDPGRFDLRLGPAVVRAGAGDGDSGTAQVAPGTYRVTESGAAGTTLSSYATSIACTLNGLPGPAVDGTTQLDVTLVAGDRLQCTLTNRRTT